MRDDGLPTVEELAAHVHSQARDEAAIQLRAATQLPAATRPAVRLRAAIGIGRELSETGDALIERFVAEARAAGLSWTEIGQSFGTSKQAAQKRYGDAGWAPTARNVLDKACGEARVLGDNHVGTEHALLVLLSRPDDVAAEVLAGLGVTREQVMARLVRALDPRPGERLCIMPRFKQALEHAGRIADRLGRPVPGTEHLLAGIVGVPDALAVEILASLGVTAGDVRAALAARLGVDAQRLVVPPRRRRRLLAKTG